ncbi:uncharacterized protein Tco025E_08276 [Trypanosoma conorhini]|uniref:Uncharacterized protein n=1 Tax=Trypanosoma conorhini TaxID=83891 RepID=A0A422NBV8_9TRYP|nr:uncharacterized protein Tco025E_08276 [Trypanosoma conorhini]RNF02977.1 hypothetical protein Tco025E_08276 [Trypanosoma conorhini]
MEVTRWDTTLPMTHEPAPAPTAPVAAVSALFEESRLRGQHAAATAAMNQHYTTLYNSLLTLSRRLGAGLDPLLDGEAAGNGAGPSLHGWGIGTICSHDCGTLFRVRCEEECRQLEAQLSFLRAALAEKQLECEKLRAQGRASRLEVENVLPLTLAINRKLRLSTPSDGEALFFSMRSAAAPTAPAPGIPAAAASKTSSLLTMAEAIAALEDLIRLQEQDILRNDKSISSQEKRHFVLQTLREDLQDARQLLWQEVESLNAAQADALEAEEEKSRLLLESETMTWVKKFEDALLGDIAKQSAVLTQRAAKARRMHQALQRVLAEKAPGTELTDHGTNVDKGAANEEEEGSNLETLEFSVQQLRTVQELLARLNTCVVSPFDDVEEIENVVKGIKSQSQSSSRSTGTHLEAYNWRSCLLQEAFTDAARELYPWQAREELNVTAAAKLLKKLRRLCIVNNIFSHHPEALVGAVMGSTTSWREVHHMLPAAQLALTLLRKRH